MLFSSITFLYYFLPVLLIIYLIIPSKYKNKEGFPGYNALEEAINDNIDYIKKEMGLAIGETTAEEIKKEIGCVLPLMTEMSMEIRGRDLTNGLPRNVVVTSSQIQEAIQNSINEIVDIVRKYIIKD